MQRLRRQMADHNPAVQRNRLQCTQGYPPGKTCTATTSGLSKSENGTYAVNKIVRHSMQPAGRLKRLAVAVLVDDNYNPANKNNPRQRRSAEEMKSIEEIAKASVGFDIARGDILHGAEHQLPDRSRQIF